jgi:hypothetical protein
MLRVGLDVDDAILLDIDLQAAGRLADPTESNLSFDAHALPSSHAQGARMILFYDASGQKGVVGRKNEPPFSQEVRTAVSRAE